MTFSPGFIRASFLIFTAILAFVLYSQSTKNMVGMDEIKENTFSYLDDILKEKKSKALKYLGHQKQVAENITDNPDLVNKFKELNRLYLSGKPNNDSESKIDFELQEYYAYKLTGFYDLIFINDKGDIFYTVKKEDDYHHNINDDMFSGLSLQNKLKDASFSFIDYEYYKVSEEPASFYLSPVYDGEAFIGHIVLQLPINAINNIFIDRTALGKTGEVYLLNKNHLMLTDSRFVNTSTVLRKKINTEAVIRAQVNGKSQKIIQDYRGKWVFSQHETFQYEGTDWIIIAEIDEDEVLSDFYIQNENYAFDLLMTSLNSQPESTTLHKQTTFPELVKADVNEYIKSITNTAIHTSGVATCTALAVYYPSSFSYLAHITPTDSIYNDGWLHQLGLGDNYTNYVDTIIHEIKHYDLKPSEFNNLKFVLAAPNTDGFKLTIHKLLAQGFWLSQINVHHMNQATSTEVYVDHINNTVTSHWKYNGKIISIMDNDQHPTLSDLLKSAIQSTT